MITINCDIGERGVDHPVDLALMKMIKIANLACGGHAGDEESVAVFSEMAKIYNVEIAAHLSYPDTKNFGRVSMKVSKKMLFAALDRQFDLLPEVQQVKFHGALYNDAAIDHSLAEDLTQWLQQHNICRVITGPTSELAKVCRKSGISVLNEFFAERRYTLGPKTDQLTLVSRTKDYASINDPREAFIQCKTMIEEGKVNVWQENKNGALSSIKKEITADTICIHSDSNIALTLAKELSAYLRSQPEG